MHLTVNQHRLYYEVSGPQDGAPVILLHHGLGSILSWDEQVPSLAEAGYRVFAYDRWGHGKSDLRPSFAMPEFREDLEDLQSLMVLLQIDRTCLIGHSDGGTISLYFAALYPDLAACLVTVAAHTYVEPKMEPSLLEVQAAYRENRRFGRGMARAHGDKGQAVLQNWFDGWAKESNRTWDMRPILGQITCPALIIQGMEDEHATPQHAVNTAASIPGAEIWLVPEVGHMLPQDKSSDFNRKVLEFLRVNYPVVDSSLITS